MARADRVPGRSADLAAAVDRLAQDLGRPRGAGADEGPRPARPVPVHGRAEAQAPEVRPSTGLAGNARPRGVARTAPARAPCGPRALDRRADVSRSRPAALDGALAGGGARADLRERSPRRREQRRGALARSSAARAL